MRVSRPIEVVVLNCWVTATKETPLASNDHPGEVGKGPGQPINLVDDNRIDQALADIRE